ncbi:hypothetical protein KSF_107410 [Reticulibacter mediterranei]|uniref:Uncharacterized protein n=1 Tax=Reticulibacter mediterranei TaxID=2778369 RepID=A0A8J3IY91_9CHLR|nr:hypothetical protein [Reticulibacter mediterranei]GHP00694.1 hypothetical protein KSF_107410 [Reticulibacter mediterranei]
MATTQLPLWRRLLQQLSEERLSLIAGQMRVNRIVLLRWREGITAPDEEYQRQLLTLPDKAGT